MNHRLLTLAFLLLLPALAFAHGDSEEAEKLQEGIRPCLLKLSEKERNACYDPLCTFSLSCARSLVSAGAEVGGPETGTQVLEDLMSRKSFAVTGDGHNLAHEIGRTTARHFEGSGEAFMRCPDDYFLGCKHGFFEVMLGELRTSAEAASRVCETLPRTERMFCYHGMGHGIMMAQTNSVLGSLKTCDTLPGVVAQNGCYQGVFMENVNAALRGEARSGVFDPADILAPCSTLNPKYRLQCFSQHADYVLRILSGSLLAPIEACEGAEKDEWIDACIRHLGQNMATVEYQGHFLNEYVDTPSAAHALRLCREFPEEHQDTCIQGAVHNFMLYDHPEQAIRLCIDSGEATCSSIMSFYLFRPKYTAEVRSEYCGMFPSTLGRFYCKYPSVLSIVTEFFVIILIAIPSSIVILGFLWYRSRKNAPNLRYNLRW